MVPAHFHEVNNGKMKLYLVKKYSRITHESLLDQFISGNPYLSRRTYTDNSVELVKPCVALDMFKTFTTTPAQPVELLFLFKSPARNTNANY